MRNLICVILSAVILSGCASSMEYDTARFRRTEFDKAGISLSVDGLSDEQINSILSTKPPRNFPINCALLVIGSQHDDRINYFISNVISELKTTGKIDRITPVPEFLIPGEIGFSEIQELGIRTLSEYVLVFVVNPGNVFKWIKLEGLKYEARSFIDFMLVDSRTTALLASDSLFTKEIYTESVFKVNESEKAIHNVLDQQVILFGEKIDKLLTVE